MNSVTKQLKSIDKLAEAREFRLAHEKCASLLIELPEFRSEILRHRAYVFALEGDLKSAIDDRTEVVSTGLATLSDHFLLSVHLVNACHFEMAGERLRLVLQIGAAENEHWFESAALLLLSHALLQQGRLSEALVCLDKAEKKEPHCAFPIAGYGIVNVSDVRQRINSRLDGR